MEIPRDPSPQVVSSSENAPAPSVPRKRVFMDAVVVPSLASLKKSKYFGRAPGVKAEQVEVPITIKPEPLTDDDIVKLEFLRSNVGQYILILDTNCLILYK